MYLQRTGGACMERTGTAKHRWRLYLIMILTAAAIVLGGRGTVKEAEAAGTDTALSTNGTWVSGSIAAKNEADYYRVTLPSAGYLTVKYQAQTISTSCFVVYNGTRTKQYAQQWMYDASASNPKSSSKMFVLEAGTYYIRVTGSGSTTGTYRISAVFEAAGNNEEEPNNDAETAQKLSIGEKVTGLISEDDGTDWYQVTIPHAGFLTVTYQAQTLSNSYVQLYNSSRTKSYFQQYVYDATAANPKNSVKKKALEAGTYYIKVAGSSGKGRYTLTTSFQSVSTDDREPNNTAENAQTLSLGQTAEGFISEDDGIDYYKISVPRQERVTVTCQGKSLSNLMFRLYNSDQTTTYFTQYIYDAAETSPKTSVKEQDLPAGTYYISVQTTGSSHGTYSIRAAAPGSSTNTSDSNGSGNQSVNQNTNQNANQNANQGTNQNVNQNTNQSANQNINQNTDPDDDDSSDADHKDDEKKNSFSDVSTGAWYYESVEWAYEEEITSGTGNGRFSPNKTCTRKEIIMMLYKMAGKPSASGSMPFTDVRYSAYYREAVLWAYQEGIVSGTGNRKFNPDKVCTRAEIVTMLYNMEGKPSASGRMPFNDVKYSAYYRKAVIWAYKEGVASGTDSGTFEPNKNCTRAQAVQFLYNM